MKKHLARLLHSTADRLDPRLAYCSRILSEIPPQTDNFGRRLVTAARAQAWDEGWHACNRIHTEQFTGDGLGCADNPYRTEER